MNKIGGRFIVKKTNVPNLIPTISIYPQHTSGMWIDTDIYEGELFINTHDNRFWFRSIKNQIIELPVLNSEDLKIKENYLPDMYGKLNYKGIFNKEKYSINPIIGDYYIINENCIINYIDYSIGDFIVYDGEKWDKVCNSLKIIYTKDIIVDKENNKNLNDLLNELSSKNNSTEINLFNNQSVFFNVNFNNLTYKNEKILHTGNSNRNDVDWYANLLTSNKVNTKEINSEYLNVKSIKSNNIKTNEIITKNISSDTFLLNSGRLYFNNSSTFLNVDGSGILFSVDAYNLFEYSSFSKINTFYNKLKYKQDFLITDDLDIVNKKYVDQNNNETINIDADVFTDKIHLLGNKNKYINIDIIEKKEFEILIDDIENDKNSYTIMLCIESKESDFKIHIKYNNETIFIIENNGIFSLYYNSKNKKWYNY